MEVSVAYILLIEDNQANADMIIHILSTAGYQIKHYIKGLDGAREARSNRPSLILMDFNLPDIDGRTLAFNLRRQLGNNAAPPIIACTSRTGSSEPRLAEHFGCSAFLAKPFTPD